jgi:hypothetical protein
MNSVPTFDALSRRAGALGVAVRGGFHLKPGEFDGVMPPSPNVRTMVLLGFTGSEQWPIYVSSAEAGDGLPDPLDRWSRRIIGSLASEFGAVDVYPSGIPYLPFQRFALHCEVVHASPIGLLIHPKWGLWHAYRGALIFPVQIELPPVAPSVHPCAGCAAKPCLSSCPVEAFSSGALDVDACVNHVLSEAGADCRDHGCRARRACPVGAEFGYVAAQARFHMKAFVTVPTCPPARARRIRVISGGTPKRFGGPQ